MLSQPHHTNLHPSNQRHAHAALADPISMHSGHRQPQNVCSASGPRGLGLQQEQDLGSGLGRSKACAAVLVLEQPVLLKHHEKDSTRDNGCILDGPCYLWGGTVLPCHRHDDHLHASVLALTQWQACMAAKQGCSAGG